MSDPLDLWLFYFRIFGGVEEQHSGIAQRKLLFAEAVARSEAFQHPQCSSTVRHMDMKVPQKIEVALEAAR
jgi:hypothetical protein